MTKPRPTVSPVEKSKPATLFLRLLCGTALYKPYFPFLFIEDHSDTAAGRGSPVVSVVPNGVTEFDWAFIWVSQICLSASVR